MDANIQKYQAFVEVADAGSFTKAAETLAYSQSGISHMVSDLERDWGVALFERSRRGVVLTGDGARLLPEARALCESFRALEATVDEVRGLETGLIRIGVFPSVAAHWIPRIIKRFSADYPGIDYKLRVGDYTEIEEWIADGTVDCGFVLLPLRTTRGSSRAPWRRTSFWPCFRATTSWRARGCFPWSVLRNFRCSRRHRSPTTSFWSSSSDGACALPRVSPRGTIGPFSPWWSTAWA